MTNTFAPDAIVSFPDGLPGFETARRFVLGRADGLAPFTLVRGVDPGAPAFVAIEPARVDPQFPMTLGAADRRRLDAADDDVLLWLALVTIDDDGSATANLRAPIVINPARMVGIQVVDAEGRYALNHPLLAA